MQVVSNSGFYYVKIILNVTEDHFKGTFAFEILNQMDQSILTSHDFDLGKPINDKGLYEVLIPIPNLLRPGKYYLNIGSNISGSTTLEYFSNVLSFEYIDTLYNGLMQHRPGMIFLPLEWDAKKIN